MIPPFIYSRDTHAACNICSVLMPSIDVFSKQRFTKGLLWLIFPVVVFVSLHHIIVVKIIFIIFLYGFVKSSAFSFCLR